MLSSCMEPALNLGFMMIFTCHKNVLTIFNYLVLPTLFKFTLSSFPVMDVTSQ